MSSGIGDRMAAEKAYITLIGILDKYSALKGYDPKRNDFLKDFAKDTLALIEQGFAGDMQALSKAEANMRAVEAAYHLSPPEWRQTFQALQRSPSTQSSRQSELERVLEVMRPPTGWRKYRDQTITAIITAFATGIVTLVVFPFLIRLGL